MYCFGGLEAAPHAPRAGLGLDVGEQPLVLRELFRARLNNDELWPFALRRRRQRSRSRTIELDREAVLAAGHGEIDLGQQRRVEQRTVERAVAVVDLITLAQLVERIFLAGMQLLGLLQRVHDRDALTHERIESGFLQLRIEKLDVEVGVVDHQRSTADEIEEIGCQVAELGLVLEKIVADAVHRQRARLAPALRLEVVVPSAFGDAPIEDLDAADFDDPVAEPDVEARGFGIEHYAAHRSLTAAILPPGWRARRRARSPDAPRAPAPNATRRGACRRGDRAPATDPRSSPAFYRRCASRGASSRAATR